MIEMLLGGIFGQFGRSMNYFMDEFFPSREQRFAEKSFEDNLKFQKDKLEYDKKLQETIFEREDNAVRRRVADLKAAGINPIFAAGSSAGAGSVVPTIAPHGDMSGVSAANANKLHKIQLAMQMMRMKSEIDHTNADTDRIRKDIEYRDHEIGWRDKELGFRGKEMEMRKAHHNLDIQLKQNDVDMIKVLNTRQRLENEIIEMRKELIGIEKDSMLQRLDLGEIDYLSKQIELQAARLELNNEQRDTLIRTTLGLMKKYPFNGEISAAVLTILQNAVRLIPGFEDASWDLQSQNINVPDRRYK